MITILLVITIVLLCVGVCFAIPASVLSHIDEKQDKCEEETEGTVIEYVTYVTKRNIVTVPVVEYKVDGEKYQKSMNVDIAKTEMIISGAYPIGSTIPVYYEENKPKNAYILCGREPHLKKFLFKDVAIFFCSLGAIAGIVTFLISTLR